MRATLLALASLCLFGTFAQAQDPADFFDYKKERHFLDSIRKKQPDVSQEEIRQQLDSYYSKRADSHYQAYQKRTKQQKKSRKLAMPHLRAQAVSQSAVLNSATSEGLVPDAVEYAALVAFYDAMGGDNWRYKNNWLQGNTSADFANWYGVGVESGDVTSLDFGRNNLQGVLPPEIGNLRGLRFLYLLFSGISSIPDEIGNLSKLEHLILHSNPLASLPSGIGNLSNLEYLNLNGTLLNTFPSEIGNLSSLLGLYARSAQLSSIPTEVGNLKDLIDLELNGNQLHSLPLQLNELPNLQWLDIGSNHFSEVPLAIADISSLEVVIIASNKLSSFPDFTNLPHAHQLRFHLSDNRIGLNDIARNFTGANT